MIFKGRLGLIGAKIPKWDRHVWLGRGRLTVEEGTLRFITAGFGDVAAGTHAIPYQMVNAIVLGPGARFHTPRSGSVLATAPASFLVQPGPEDEPQAARVRVYRCTGSGEDGRLILETLSGPSS
ncbi:MAG: hypothetical protein RLO52_24255 [Sandaracinaceae bacterium]